MPFGGLRAPVTAKSTRPHITQLSFPLAPAADTGRADPEPFAGLAMRQARRNRRQNTHAKIHRQSFRHDCRPPTRQSV